MAWGGTRYVVTATATQPFATTLGHVPLQEIAFRAPAANAGSVFIGPSTVTTTTNGRIFLAAGDGYSSGPFENGPVYADDFYVIGTANDILYIAAVLR